MDQLPAAQPHPLDASQGCSLCGFLPGQSLVGQWTWRRWRPTPQSSVQADQSEVLQAQPPVSSHGRSDAGRGAGAQSASTPLGQPTGRHCVPVPQAELQSVHSLAAQMQFAALRHSRRSAGRSPGHSVSSPLGQFTSRRCSPMPHSLLQTVHSPTDQAQPLPRQERT